MGELDVDATLAKMTPRQFAGWWQYYRLCPWGGDWHRSSLQTARTLNTLRAIAMSMGGSKTAEADLIEDDAFVPKWRDSSEDTVAQDISKQCEAADSIEGFGF